MLLLNKANMDTIYKYLMDMCHTSVYNRTLNCTIQEIFIMIITHRVAPGSSTLAAFIYEFLWEHILALNNKNQSSFHPTHFFFLKQFLLFLYQVILGEWLYLAQVILGLRGGMLGSAGEKKEEDKNAHANISLTNHCNLVNWNVNRMHRKWQSSLPSLERSLF